MTSFGSWRFTAMLGVVAIVLSAGILSWVMVTIADLNYTAPSRSVELSMLPQHDQRNDFANDFANNLVEADESGRAGLGISGWESDLSWLGKGSFAPQGFLDLAAPLQFEPNSQPLAAAPASQSDWQSDPPGQQTTSSVPEAAVGHPQRLAQDHRAGASRAATPKPHKPTARSYYVEKSVEQGDSGDVKFRYRRRNCAPSNMVDVCYMPAEIRRGIIVERW